MLHLIQSERKLTSDDGLPRRPWYKHLIYAPGVYSGYGVKTIPSVREGIEQKKYQEAEQEIVRVANALEEEAAADRFRFANTGRTITLRDYCGSA